MHETNKPFRIYIVYSINMPRDLRNGRLNTWMKIHNVTHTNDTHVYYHKKPE